MAMSRRRFAALLGTSAVSASTLPSLLGRVTAQAPSAPVRFLAVRTPHGVDRDYWIPKTSGGGEPAADEALSALTFEYTNSILQPMMPWRDQITVLDGLDTQIVRENTRNGVYAAHGHGEQGTLLTGAQPPGNRDGNYDGHPSLDFYLHGRLNAPALITASAGGGFGSWKCLSYDGNGLPRGTQSNPRDVFRTAFPSDYVPPDASTEPTVDYTPGERKIFMANLEELQRIENRLSGNERDKVKAHREAFERMVPDETSSGFTGSCTTRGSDVPSDDGRIGDYSQVRRVVRSQAQVIGQAFACGRSRCATLGVLSDHHNFYTDVPDVKNSGIQNYNGSTYRYHDDLVHKYWEGASGDLIRARREGYCLGLRWAAGHFAAILEELSGMPDPQDPNGGTILDNTVIFWHSEFGHGPHDGQWTRHPAIIAGGGGRTLRLGRYLRLRNIDSNDRVAHNKLLVSIAHAMGVTDIDYFGDRDLRDNSFYRGPLAPLMA